MPELLSNAAVPCRMHKCPVRGEQLPRSIPPPAPGSSEPTAARPASPASPRRSQRAPPLLLACQRSWALLMILLYVPAEAH